MPPLKNPAIYTPVKQTMHITSFPGIRDFKLKWLSLKLIRKENMITNKPIKLDVSSIEEKPRKSEAVLPDKLMKAEHMLPA